MEAILSRLDVLYEAKAHAEAHAVAEQGARQPWAASSFAFGWRLARAQFNAAEVARLAAGGDNAAPARVRLLEETVATTTRLISQHPAEAEAHKYHAIAVQQNSDHRGIREKIAAGVDFHRHTLRALELAPNDATLHYMLGRFSYEVAKLSSWERMAARAAFGSEPPRATFSEALAAHQRACELRKGGPEIRDHLEVGNCCVRLNDREGARRAFQAALAAPRSSDPDDAEAEQAARDELAKL